MSEENRSNPIIEFQPRKQDNGNTPGGGNNTNPKWVLNGKELSDKSQILVTDIDEIYKDWDKNNIEELPHVLIINFIDKAKSKSNQAKILPVFTFGNDNRQIGFVGEDSILIKIESKKYLSEINKKLKDLNKNALPISAITSIKNYEPNLKKGTMGYSYEIIPMDYWNDDLNLKALEIIQKRLKEKDISYQIVKYPGNYRIVKTEYITKDSLQFVRKLPIRSANPMNKIRFPKSGKNNVDYIDSSKCIKYDSNKDYPLVGLLDTGVSINGLTKGWVARGKGCQYKDDELNTYHGTYIATLLIYGDEINNVNDSSVLGCRIIDVPIIPKEGVDEDRLLKNIEIAVEKNPEVKIWNLSVSGDGVISESGFSNFAIVLDSIQKKYNVIICKSAGNDGKNCFKKLKNEKLSTGADSIRSIVVGSLNRNSDKYGFTKAGFASPYSRRGNGPESVIKPDVVHYGGDLLAQVKFPQSISDCKIEGDKSSVDGKNIVKTVGTSFSTPKIAKQLSELQLITNNKYSNLTLKALELHSAKYNESVIKLSEEEKLCTLGYGLPQNPATILYDSPFKSTCILEGRIEHGRRIDIMDFPYPNILIKDNVYYGKIKLTLVCDPWLLRNNDSEYCQSNLDIKFGTYSKKSNTKSYMQKFNALKREDTFNLLRMDQYSKKSVKENTTFADERLLLNYGKKYQVVKKYVIDLSELRDKNKENLLASRKWFLFLEGHYRNLIESEAARCNYKLSIPFSLIITIEDPSKNQNVYDSSIRALKNNNFIYNPVRINNRIQLHG